MTAITEPSPTFSLASLGASYGVAPIGQEASQTLGKARVQISDANAPFSAQQNLLMTGQSFLCQNPDGSQSNYVLDAERSTPTSPVLRKV